MSIAKPSRAAALIVSLLFASTVYAQTPDFRVQIWGNIEADFTGRVSSYADLRSRLAEGLPVLTVTDDPTEIKTTVHALAARIRVARSSAKPGEIFTPAIGAAFRRALAAEMNANVLAVILDDNPGGFTHRINRSYSRARPLSTVPGVILAALPTLPDDIQYRFLGRDLILHDTRADLIVDRLPCAITCRN